MPDDKFLKAMILDLKVNKKTYNKEGKLTSSVNRKTEKKKKKQQEIKIEEIAKPFLKELRKKKKHKLTKEQEEKMLNDILTQLRVYKEIHSLKDRGGIPADVKMTSNEYFVDFKDTNKVDTSNSMSSFENYQSYNNESSYNSNKDKDLVKNIVKTIYQRPCKVEKNPVSEMYYISKNNAKKKNNTPCNLKTYYQRNSIRECS